MQTVTSAAATFECWIKLSAAAGVADTPQTIVICNDPGSASPRLSYDGGERLGFYWNDSFYSSTDTRPIADGQWHHVAVVFSNNWVQFYKDGIPTADTFQMPDQQSSGGVLQIGAAVGSTQAFNGLVSDVRMWSVPRRASQISSFRYVPLTGTEAGLVALSGTAGSILVPSTLTPVNVVSGLPGSVQGAAAIVQSTPPQQALPQSVWTFPTPGLSPVGPMLSAQGLLCTDNLAATGASGGSYLRSVDLQSGEQIWSTDITSFGNVVDGVVPAAVTVADGVAYAGVQASNPTILELQSLEIHTIDMATGAPVWDTPFSTVATEFLARPVVGGGQVIICVNHGIAPDLQAGMLWTDIAGAATVGAFVVNRDAGADFMSEPLLNADSTIAYVGSTYGSTALVHAVPINDSPDDAYLWQQTLQSPVTADLGCSDSALFVPMGGTIVALSTADGATQWSHELSGSPVHARPTLLGATLCVGSTDGVLYALDTTAQGTELWRVDVGSPIITDLVNEDGILYFATQGDGRDVAPAFFAVDANSMGRDVLTYDVPAEDTILFVQGGVTNGVVYFYGSQAVYAVNMAGVIHEFTVNSKLIVEAYSIPTDVAADPVGSDTSYRVTLAVSDQYGMPRTNQAVKVWSADTLYVVNQGSSPVTLTPDTPVWMQTDSSGDLTLAISAFDDGTPSGTPNLACPPVYVWANFMSAGEAIVIYPDNEQLTTLAQVQGSSADAVGSAAGPAQLYLDQATGYDGTPLVQSAYSSAPALTAIAATIRNTIGTRSTTTLSSGLGSSAVSKHLATPTTIPHALYAVDATAPTERPYVPGAEPVFTVDFGSGAPVYTAGTFDDARPAGLTEIEVGGIFSDIKHFVGNVVKGTEQIGKLAWQATENAVTTVIHTAENVYNLTITGLEDAVTVVTGFLKTVVNDIRAAIQWLSALFGWGDILANHNYLRNAISNPTDPDNPGVLDALSSWVTAQLNGGTDVSSTFGQIGGQGSSAMASAAAGAQGQTVQSTQSGNNDPNAAYNYGGNNNAGQCTWMRQKLKENSGSASLGSLSTEAVGGTALGGWDPATITGAWDTFMGAVGRALEGSFSGLPDQINQQLRTSSVSFKDPATLLSTGLSDLLTVFEVIGDDIVDFAEAVARDFVTLLGTLLSQIVSWLNEPIRIPFISELYRAITHGDELTILDLICLIGAIPATILLEVLTGSPTVPAAEADLGGASARTAGLIIAGVAAFETSVAALIADTISITLTVDMGNNDAANKFWSPIDFALDLVSWSTSMAVSQGWAAWEAQDWVFWAVQAIPQAFNFVYLFASSSAANQLVRDTTFGVAQLVLAGVYSHYWPQTYRDAPKAPGMVLAENLLGGLTGVVEFLLFFTANGEYELLVDAAKVSVGTAANYLNFASYVLGLVEGS